jgi:hypothetical protein
MVLGYVAEVLEVHAASETKATWPTSTECNNPRRELTSTIYLCENLKSVLINIRNIPSGELPLEK